MSARIRYLVLAPILVCSVSLAGCGTTPGDRGLSGGLLGAGTGAAIGAMAGSAGTGALIGGLAGGGKGALIGGLVGAGAGTAGAAFTGKKDASIPAESVVSFTTTSPITVTIKPKAAAQD